MGPIEKERGERITLIELYILGTKNSFTLPSQSPAEHSCSYPGPASLLVKFSLLPQLVYS